jgi:hypothetical protein
MPCPCCKHLAQTTPNGLECGFCDLCLSNADLTLVQAISAIYALEPALEHEFQPRYMAVLNSLKGGVK